MRQSDRPATLRLEYRALQHDERQTRSRSVSFRVARQPFNEVGGGANRCQPHVSDNSCELNWSAQHLRTVYSQESRNLRFFAGVDLDAARSCPVWIACSRMSGNATSMIGLCQEGKSSPDALGRSAGVNSFRFFSACVGLSAVVPISYRTRLPLAVSKISEWSWSED